MLMQIPPGFLCRAVGFEGQEYEVIDGAVEVPDKAEAWLTEQGFSRLTPEEAAEEAPAEEAPAKKTKKKG